VDTTTISWSQIWHLHLLSNHWNFSSLGLFQRYSSFAESFLCCINDCTTQHFFSMSRLHLWALMKFFANLDMIWVGSSKISHY